MIDYYHCLGNIESKNLFLSVIAGDLGVDHERIATKAQKFVDLHANVRSWHFTANVLIVMLHFYL